MGRKVGVGFCFWGLLLGIAFGNLGEGGILVAICGVVSCFGFLFFGLVCLGFSIWVELTFVFVSENPNVSRA